MIWGSKIEEAAPTGQIGGSVLERWPEITYPWVGKNYIFVDRHSSHFSFFFLFWLLHGVPGPGMESRPEFWTMPQLQQCQIFNPLCQAGDWTLIPASAEILSILFCHSGNSTPLNFLILLCRPKTIYSMNDPSFRNFKDKFVTWHNVWPYCFTVLQNHSVSSDWGSRWWSKHSIQRSTTKSGDLPLSSPPSPSPPHLPLPSPHEAEEQRLGKGGKERAKEHGSKQCFQVTFSSFVLDSKHSQ